MTNDDLDRLLAPYFSTLGRKIEDIEVSPRVFVPELKIPEVKVPKIDVKVPEITVPEIKLPDIKIPPIHVPKPEVTVNVDKVKVQNWPKMPEFDDTKILAALKRLENKTGGGGGGSAPQYQDTSYNTDAKLWGIPIMWQEPVTVGSTNLDQTNVVSAAKPLPVNVVDGDITITAGDIEIGAVELKNAADDTRAAITSANSAAGNGLQTLVGSYWSSRTALTNGQIDFLKLDTASNLQVLLRDSSDAALDLTTGGQTGVKVMVVGDSDKYVRGNVAEGAAVSDPVYVGMRDGSGNVYGLRGSTSGLKIDLGSDNDVTVTNTTASNLNAQVVGDVASGGTDSGNPVKVGGVYRSSPSTLTNGQRSDLMVGSYGNLKTEAWSGGSAIQNAYGNFVQGGISHDSAQDTMKPVKIGGTASAAAPSDVSADNDVTNAWFLRNGAQTVALTAAGALIGGDATNGLDADVTRVIPGTSATHLGKAVQGVAGATDTGVALLAVRKQEDGHDDAVADGQYGRLSVTDFRELRTQDQRTLDLDKCNATTDWTGLNTDTPTANIAVSTNHVFGTRALSFDKVDGAANTIYGCIQKTLTTINASELFESGGFVGMSMYLSSLTNVVGVFLRIGTSSSHYNAWFWSVDNLTAATWMNLRTAAAQPDHSRNTGNGWDPSAITYLAVGVEFANEANTLSGILVDHIHMVKGRVTSTDITTSTTVSGAGNVNVVRLGGTATATNSGNKSNGTLRVVLATDQPQLTNKLLVTEDSGSAIKTSVEIMDDWDESDRCKVNLNDNLSISRNIDVDESGDNQVNAACKLFGYYVHNKNAAVLYLKLYNKATAPTVGSDTPVLTIPVPSGAAANVSFARGIAFSTGLGVGATTGVADNDTGAPGANDMVLNLFYV